MGPLYLEGGSFIGLGIHITKNCNGEQRKKKQRQKNLNSFRRGKEALCL